MNRRPTHPPLFWRHMWTFPNKYVCLTEKRYTLSSISLKINDFICVISVKLKNSIWLEDFENDLEYCSLNYGHSSGVGRLQDEPDCKDVSTRHHTTTMHHRHHHTLSTELTNLMGSDGRPVSNHHQGWALRRDGIRGTGQDPVRRFYRDGTGSDTNGTGLDFENVCRDGIGISRNGTGWNFKGRVWMNSFTFWNIIHKVSCPFITSALKRKITVGEFLPKVSLSFNIISYTHKKLVTKRFFNKNIFHDVMNDFCLQQVNISDWNNWRSQSVVLTVNFDFTHVLVQLTYNYVKAQITLAD